MAANLGILGDSPAAQAAKKTIQVQEFMPRLTQLHPRNQPEHRYVLRLGEEFEVYNPNPQPEEIEISLAVQPSLPVVLCNVRLVNCDTQEFVAYKGKVEASDVLSFREDIVEVNGKPYATEGTPLLTTNTSRWRLEAQLAEGYPLARFDQQRFDQSTFALSQPAVSAKEYPLARFDQQRFDQSTFFLSQPAVSAKEYPLARFDQQRFDQSTFSLSQPAVSVKMRFYQLTPGVFEVKIPWDIPGFTDKFQEAGDHPRHQIAGIIDKVKAAGVLGIITYEKRFQETHEMVAQLTVERSPFLEEHLAEDTLTINTIQVPYPEGIVHEMSDNLLTCGVFDYTGFDSGNRFA
ncbi:hypothetical protein [Moorena sp. SIO4A5]|uniref:hypothetical protein n=1 Tax=Moorena sp. SIO4A5 TaxID=2607838 RepID=UPI0025D49461|nr:hypothetical protein [Moorena sp. SIO4A5]